MIQAALPNTLDFALLGHPDSYDHIGDLFLHSRPDYSLEKLRKYKATLLKFFEWTPSYISKTLLEPRTSEGRSLCGRLIICTYLPEMINSPRQMMMAYHKTRDACRLARDAGAKVVGLGGFTSIVGGTQGEGLANEFQIAVTSGNSLTAGLAIAQLDDLLQRLDWDLKGRTVAVVGASGDIGRACSLTLARRVRRILLIARNRAKLEALRSELPVDVEVHVDTNTQSAVLADVIIAATSSAEPVLAEADLHTGSIVCDVGYPKNLAYTPNPRSDVLVFSAGLAEMPFDLNIQYYTRLPTPRIMYGCFSEAIVLAMTDRYESFSIGQGRISPEKMDLILTLAHSQGFHAAPLYRGNIPLTDTHLETFLRQARLTKEDH
jgi:fatty aldehyde-generating acyl-ACP reductase